MIVRATQQHIQDVYKLLCILEEKELDFQLFEKKYQLGLNNRDVYYFVLIENEIIKGYMGLCIHHYLHHDYDTGEITELVIHPSYRGQRIGSQFIEYIECFAKENKLEEIELTTSLRRKKAHHFYEKHGFIMDHYNYIKKLNR